MSTEGQQTDESKHMQDSNILHGGAHRLPLRIVSGGNLPVQRISWYEIAPGDQCTRHVHQGKAETWLVISGHGMSRVGDDEIAVGPGDMLITPPGTPHGLQNTGQNPLRFVNIVMLEGPGPVTTTEVGP